MYQLIVIVMQFCFAYPKNKPSIDKQTDQVTTPGVTKSIDCSMKSRCKKEEEIQGGKQDEHLVDNYEGENEAELIPTDNQGDTFTPSNASSLINSSGLSGCPPPVTEMVQKNVNITVSYNPPPKSLYTSFDQLRSSRPNCFISSIIRGDGHPTAPGIAVKTTEIKSPEEVTGVKSPSPEAWRVAIDTGTGINWTQAIPVTTTSNNTINNEITDEKVFFMGRNANQLTSKLANNKQSTFPETNINSNQLDGSQSNQIVTKETKL